MTKQIEEDLAAGVHVRHKKQPDWGIGLVESVVHVGDARADVVVDFETVGRKKLRLSQDMFDWVADEELQARADAEAAAKKAAKKQKAAATPKSAQKSTALTPFQTVNGSFSDAVAVAGVVFAVERGGAVHAYDANGNGGVVGGAPNAWPARWTVVDDVAFGSDVHGDSGYLVVDGTTKKAKTWTAPRRVGLPRARAFHDEQGHGGFVVWGQHELFLVDKAAQTVADVRLPFVGAGQTLSDVVCVGGGFVGCVYGPAGAAEAFHIVGFGKDGVERWRQVGLNTDAVGPHAVFIQHHAAVVVDAAGAVVVRVEDVHAVTGHNGEDGFVAVDNSDVVCVAHEHVVRLSPTAGLLWRTKTPWAQRPPVVAGAVVAAAAHMYGDNNKDVVFVDANDGHVIAEGAGAGTVTDVVAVDSGAFALISNTKKIVVWTKLHTPSPARLSLMHDDKVFSAVSPAAGILVTNTGEQLAFWKV